MFSHVVAFVAFLEKSDPKGWFSESSTLQQMIVVVVEVGGFITQWALGCFLGRNTPGKCPDKAKYSHTYPAGHIIGLFNKILSGICFTYLLVNV